MPVNTVAKGGISKWGATAYEANSMTNRQHHLPREILNVRGGEYSRRPSKRRARQRAWRVMV